MLPWTGHYINLDRSHQRRSSIERELRAAGILSSHRRFAAVDGSLLAPVEGLTGAEFGCIRSHSEVILASAGFWLRPRS
jgi:GR25 family glycosyltransferase involved in LPS biosynthesis